jgi:NAD(P)-dependent dehydrogenase (short-subunit alcohol dehydrogenase family)
MSNRLAGKVCIITGSGGAIGRASALVFAREGAKLVGCDLHAENSIRTTEEVRETGGEMVSVEPCDLTSKSDCARVVALAIKEFGQVDVLFNNSGRPFHGWMDHPDEDHWYQTIDSEMHSVFLMSKTAWPALQDSGGTIVNVASVSGWSTYSNLPGIAHSAAKGAVISLTRHLAMEGRHYGIRANSISPGTISTPAVEAKAEDEKWATSMKARIMRGSFGRPEEVAHVALFLASDESSFVNAADIRVDGGSLSW